MGGAKGVRSQRPSPRSHVAVAPRNLPNQYAAAAKGAAHEEIVRQLRLHGIEGTVHRRQGGTESSLLFRKRQARNQHLFERTTAPYSLRRLPRERQRSAPFRNAITF